MSGRDSGVGTPGRHTDRRIEAKVANVARDDLLLFEGVGGAKGVVDHGLLDWIHLSETEAQDCLLVFSLRHVYASV